MKRIIGSVFACVLLLVSIVTADDIIASIDNGKQYYSQGKYSQANQELLFAVQQIQGKLADLYSAALPPEQPGWELDGPNTDNMTLLGGGISVQSQYSFYGDDDIYKTVSINIVSDSPLLSSVMMLINNPMFMPTGSRAVTIEGYKAVEEWYDDSGKLQFVMDNRILVTVETSGLQSKDEMHAWAKKIDFAQLKKLLAS
ncbi:hypothetical protein KQI52_01425 [bacterium]|nr:hypothetical protein [bacterium]